MKRRHVFVEHYCIPAGLFLLNMSVIHFLFILASGPVYTLPYKAAVGVAVLALAAGVIAKNRWIIPIASLWYLLVFCF